MFHWRSITDLEAQGDLLRPRSHGLIELVGGQRPTIRLRPWPRMVSLAEAYVGGRLYHRWVRGDFCRLYFNQPRAFPNYLVLKYAVSAAETSWATCSQTLDVLDRVAEIKGVDALLCEASNLRISDRALRRKGWAPHCPSSWRRHFIKRFSQSKVRRFPRLAAELMLAETPTRDLAATLS